MQSRIVVNPTETWDRMLSMGMDPFECRDFLSASVQQQRHNFEMCRKMLSPKQRNAMELRILNGEIMLSVVSNACLLQGLP
jgi:hypothetical protein